MNNKNCKLCKNYGKDGYCEELEFRPCYPEKGCDYFSERFDLTPCDVAISRQAAEERLKECEDDEYVIDIFIKCLIKDFNKYQKEWLTSHNDIEFDRPEEDLILAFLDDTADQYISEHIE